MEYWKKSYRIPDTLVLREEIFVQPSGFLKPFSQVQTITPTTPGNRRLAFGSFQRSPNKATSSGRGFFTL